MKAEDDRSRNLLVFGIEEKDGESLQTKVSELLEQLDEVERQNQGLARTNTLYNVSTPSISPSPSQPLDSVSCKRVGKCAAGSTPTRLINFRVNSSETVFQILKKAKRF